MHRPLCFLQHSLTPAAVRRLSTPRSRLLDARRIMVKLGSQVVTRSGGAGVSLGRVANIVEQVSHLKTAGREMVVVSSGAVAAGRQVFLNQSRNTGLAIPSRPYDILPKPNHPPLAPTQPEYAAVGQNAIMALYDAMFKVYGISCGQVLVDVASLQHAASLTSTASTVSSLMGLGVVPIINENDVIQSTYSADGSVGLTITDNDGIAAVMATALNCDLLLLLSNVDGVFSDDPAKPDARLLPLVTPKMLANDSIAFGEKSGSGRGGMESKCGAAIYAMEQGVDVVVANGMQWRNILDIIEGEEVGTLFTRQEV
eukprot:NODE_540_length_1588_cov_84.930474_g391_i0.p1 GENE.NODE_540_length_1588_cov_84.930474_g391_i0~~NODE_540_length_1588_cov_84.930474_g391_i0.p1  ORF type:complete len:337 (+),score=77.56 NODE_540_length_1588_cov_84.930474_g391_i0:73-1011(+)